MRAMVAERLGGPDVLTPAYLPDPVPGPGQTLLDVEAAGLNFADAERLRGTYLPPRLPFIPGGEVVGRAPDGRRVAAPIDPGVLSERNIAVGGHWLGAHLRLPGSRAAAPLHDLLALTASGRIHPMLGAEYPLDQAATALTALTNRCTTGKVILRMA
ncbi:zinc-binding dehydrogenase [Nonomuraea sp. NPDC052265]|uniref:zinc-binding dehydrogenase n=1 Tax=Nonomuraea sp. NPDC052265 TaxID=3364374 RepID=UPI0037CA774F